MLIVKSIEEVSSAIDFIRSQEMLAFDIETTGLHLRRNRIIGFGVSSALDGLYVSADLDIACIHAILAELQHKKLLMFNGAFDATFVYNYWGIDLLPQLHCDVMLLKHTCDEDFPLGLKEIASKLFGADVKAEKEEMLASIKANGGKPTEYYKADPAIIAKYCIQDCLLTYKLYNHYSKELKKQNLETFFYIDEVMPLYREVVIPMERYGVQLDIPLLRQTASDLAKDISALEADIQSEIVPFLGIFTSWFLNKDYPLTTSKSGKPSAWTKKYTSQQEAWGASTECKYMFNLQSKHHLKKLFFDTLKETAVSFTDLGSPQVNEEFLNLMALKYPWAAKLIAYNKLTKLEGTYVSRFLNEHENGRFYPSYSMHRTVSGRLAGDMQQLPRPIEAGHPLVLKYTNRIRQLIVPAGGNLLCSADYNQLEPSIFAHVSGDSRLQSIFQKGYDFYSEVAIFTERLTGVSSDKTATNYLGKVNKNARQKAKIYALGLAYGMSAYKLQFEIDTTQPEAEKLRQNYLSAFPNLAAWMASAQDAACYDGYVRTQTGRIRHLGTAKRLFEQYGICLKDSLQLWTSLHEKPDLYQRAKADRKVFVNQLNNAINFQIQGLAASIMNRAAIKLSRTLAASGLTAKICGQVHDELVLDVPAHERDAVAAITKEIMENIMVLAVPLTVQPQFGANYQQCK